MVSYAHAKTYPVKEWAALIADEIYNKNTGIIVTTGAMGKGKSVLNITLARALAEITKTKFTFKDNMTWDRSEFNKWIEDEKEGKPPFTPIIVDELIAFLYKRLWYEKEQIQTIQIVEQCRLRRIPIIGAVPNFWSLDREFRNCVDYWIHISERGHARVWSQSTNEFHDDPWMQAEARRHIDKGKRYEALRTFTGFLTWDDLPAEDIMEYEKLREEKKKVAARQYEKKEQMSVKIQNQRDNLLRYILRNKLMTTKQIAYCLGNSYEYALRIVNTLGAEMDGKSYILPHDEAIFSDIKKPSRIEENGGGVEKSESSGVKPMEELVVPCVHE